MKAVIFVLVTVLAPLFAHAEANTVGGESTLKLSEVNESINVRAQVARKEVKAIDAEIRQINDQIDELKKNEITAEALIDVSFPSNLPMGFRTIKNGFEIERAQLMADRKAMLEEATVADSK
jgi:hypothetical protein